MPRIQVASFVFMLIGFFVIAPEAWAQLEINTSGNVGLGVTPGSIYKLRLECSNTTSCGSSSSWRRGVYSVARDGYANYGVYAYTYGSNYRNTGVYGYAYGSASYNYGVYGYAGGGSNNWAGYFNGNVYTTGSYQSSDERLKTDVRSLRGSNMLAKVLQLEPRRYRYKSAAEARQQRLPDVGAPEGEHMGLLAQEVEQVFPELVMDVAHPLEEDEEESEMVMTKAINYTELIPVLIEAIREQQQQIEQLQAEVRGAKLRR